MSLLPCTCGEGEIVAYPQFDDVEPFSEGMAAVEINDKWGYISKASFEK